MPVAPARHLLAGDVVPAQSRCQRREDSILHGDIDDGALTGSLALVEGADDGAVEMHPAEKIAQRRPGFERRRILLPGDAHDAGHGLDGDVHAQVVPVRSRGAVPRAGGIDQPRVFLAQRRCADAVPVHGARREVLKHHIHFPRHALQGRLPRCGLDIERNALLARIEQGKGIAGRRRLAPSPQRLAERRLHLDDSRPRLRKQEPAVGTVVDLPEVERRHPGKRLLHELTSIGCVVNFAVSRWRNSHEPKVRRGR